MGQGADDTVLYSLILAPKSSMSPFITLTLVELCALKFNWIPLIFACFPVVMLWPPFLVLFAAGLDFNFLARSEALPTAEWFPGRCVL